MCLKSNFPLRLMEKFLNVAWLDFLTISVIAQAICSKNIKLRDFNRDPYLFDQISLSKQKPPTTPLTCINFCKLWFSSKTVKTIFKFGKCETKKIIMGYWITVCLLIVFEIIIEEKYSNSVDGKNRF